MIFYYKIKEKSSWTQHKEISQEVHKENLRKTMKQRQQVVPMFRSLLYPIVFGRRK